MFNPIDNDKHLFILAGSALLFLAIAAGILAASFKVFLFIVIVFPSGFVSFYFSHEYFTRNNTEETDLVDLTSHWFLGTSAPVAASLIVAVVVIALTAGFLQKYLF